MNVCKTQKNQLTKIKIALSRFDQHKDGLARVTALQGKHPIAGRGPATIYLTKMSRKSNGKYEQNASDSVDGEIF